jgi:hypothetical protein
MPRMECGYASLTTSNTCPDENKTVFGPITPTCLRIARP